MAGSALTDVLPKWLLRQTEDQGSGFRPCEGHCLVFLAKTLYSHLAGPDRSTQVYKRIQAKLMLGWV